MKSYYIIWAVFLAVSMACAGHPEDHETLVEFDHHAPPHYSFEYSVQDPHTGDLKGHREWREGDQVKGFYSLQEPDGTTRQVHYTADKHSGFNAIVTKSGHSVHPDHHYHHSH